VKTLKALPFDRNTNDFHFDTEIIIQLSMAGKRILEKAIPTYYGDEICYVNGMKYAKDVVKDVVRYRLNSMGFGQPASVDGEDDYALKESEDSSHGQLIAWMDGFPPSRVLDLGCSRGRVGELLRKQGHEVTGVEIKGNEDAEARLDRFIVADLEDGIPESVGTGYDAVIAGDVLEHVRDPAALLREIRRVTAPGGSLLISVPNFAHWYPRTRVTLGMFDYDSRGILDQGHVRFFTRRSFRRILQETGWSVGRSEYTGLPLDVLADGEPGGARGVVRTVDQMLVRVWPTLFAYQLLFVAHPAEVEITEEIHLQDSFAPPGEALSDAQ
jgi:SAM-dependent methyltransferase